VVEGRSEIGKFEPIITNVAGKTHRGLFLPRLGFVIGIGKSLACIISCSCAGHPKPAELRLVHYTASADSRFDSAPEKCVMHFFLGGEGSLLCRFDAEIYGLPKTDFLNDVVPGSLRQKFFGQSMKLLAHRLI
jgi:hypothetical protein